jgi:hypothetical protein
MKSLIWIAVAAIAIPLALSVNAQAQQADHLQPRAGETRLEYEARIARTRGDREALREALREKQERDRREALRKSQVAQAIKDEKARPQSDPS